MLVYRSIGLGLLGACCILLAMRPPMGPMPPMQLAGAERCRPFVVAASHASGHCRASQRTLPTPTIVDVAPGLTHAQLAQVIVLEEGEQIAAIDEVPVTSTLDAGGRLAAIDLHTQRYIDFSITGPRGPRRMLVLLH